MVVRKNERSVRLQRTLWGSEILFTLCLELLQRYRLSGFGKSYHISITIEKGKAPEESGPVENHSERQHRSGAAELGAGQSRRDPACRILV